MKINFDSELMENQTHAVVMAPDIAFEALQSQDGGSLFFSIGTDHVFYLTREVTATTTGWTKLDLSSGLASQFSGAAVTAKSFSVAQNAQTLGIDLGLVVTVSGVDHLFLSLGNANTEQAWANGVAWTAIPFDATPAPTPITITNVYLMNVLSQGAMVENIFADILSTPGNTLEPIARYYITPGASPQWNAHYLPAEMSAGSVTSCLGNRPSDPVPGIYTMGSIGGDEQLIFTPQSNYFSSTAPPNPTKLTLPAGASAVASAVNSSGVTNLFISGTGGLYVFTPSNQGANATAVVACSDPLTAGASQLAASTNGGHTAVWGVNAQGNLFYVQCAEGSEADAGAWSNPVPLLPSVERFAFYLNLNAGTNVLFANIDGQNLMQLSQDPVTANWLQRAILLPSTSVDDVASYNSFTTHIQITDDNGGAAPNTAVTIQATSPVSVYLNNVYHVLSPTVPLNTTADCTGVITVVQATDSLSAVCFQVTLTATPTVTQTINPMTNALVKLGKITDGTSLGKVVVTNSDGTQQPLIPSGTSSSDTNAAAQSIVQFHQVASGLPQNGSKVQPSSNVAAAHFGLIFHATGIQYHEGAAASALLGGSDPIAVAAEDFFLWVKHIVHEIESFTVKAVEGVYHFLATIGGEIYDVLLDCISSVVHAVEYVFNKIKVFFQDLIKWLGFIFNWKDMVNTHKAMKNVLKQSVIRAVNQIATLETDVQNAFQNLEAHLNSWAGLPPVTSTMGNYQSTSSSAPGTGSPQSNWALHHTKGNASQAATTYSTPNPNRGTFATILSELEQMVDNEIGDIKTAIAQLRTDVIDQLSSLTPLQVVQKTVAIILDFVLSTAENLIVKALQIIATVIEGMIDLLDAPISIPILSPLYKKITGDDLSFLDLTCLVCAIPATIIYKLATKKAPFSDADAQSLQNAADFDAVRKILNGPSQQPAGAMLLAAKASSQPSSLLSTTIILADAFALFGSIVTVVMALEKKGESEAGTPSRPARYMAACAYFPYVAPDIVGVFNNAGAWYTVMNDVVTVVAIVKTLTDNSDTLNTDTPQTVEENQMWRTYVSPVAECLINGVWLAPAIGSIVADHSSKSAWLGFGSNLAFDIGGLAAPASEQKIVGAEVAAVVFVGIQILTIVYGVLSAGAGVAMAIELSDSAAASATAG